MQNIIFGMPNKWYDKLSAIECVTYKHKGTNTSGRLVGDLEK